MTQRTAHQERIIRNYYQNFDQIAVQRLSEMVTDLFLAEGAKARTKLWLKAKALLEKLKVPAARIEHIEKSDNPTLLANLVQEILSGKLPTGPAAPASPASPSAPSPATSSPAPERSSQGGLGGQGSQGQGVAKKPRAASSKPPAGKARRSAKK